MASGLMQIEGLEIVPMTESDLGEVLQIEQVSFRAPWSRNMFRQDLAFPLARCLCAKLPGSGKKRVVGYVICWFVADEVHVTNIAVSAGERQRGVATRLLEEALCVARGERMRYCTLEVRLSNEAAKGFYRKLGFEARGLRPKYYSDNNEDAVIMWLDL
jgi:[ribosomal protein S18]-alanine N-acetyltransferase